MLANKEEQVLEEQEKEVPENENAEEGGGQEQAQNCQCHELLDAERNRYAELEARYLRLAADFDNVRQRTERQHKELVAMANADLMCSLLPVLDNFNHALDSVQDESILKGMQMIYQQLLDVLGAKGLAEIETVGCPFDPNVHEAVAREERAGAEDNIILAEIRKGYLLNGKVLRPAMVKVNSKKEE